MMMFYTKLLQVYINAFLILLKYFVDFIPFFLILFHKVIFICSSYRLLLENYDEMSSSSI